VIITIVWASVGTFIALKITDMVVGLRVDEETEFLGLDLAVHGESSAAEPGMSQMVVGEQA
jgi:Amt family ammonium transporter